ncbi:hypothetical protein LshimejAT787_0602990 [Lyophyllum shimeji]|uniref:Uncharacterized protein n=1 Tax=Lyophyllum shimeji TaxID=47721 RepID=A0A9P3PPR2_LYOSH|nr:hypothetical protein LshimejAT787_0602990 [Lyophyllum shimeji]
MLHNLEGVKELEFHQTSFETSVQFFRYVCTLPALEALSISRSSIEVEASDMAELRPKVPFSIRYLDAGKLSRGVLDWFLAQDPVPPVHTFRINLIDATSNATLPEFATAMGPSIANLRVTLPSDLQAYYRGPGAVDFSSFSNVSSVYIEGYLRLGEQAESRLFRDLLRTTFTQISSPILKKVSVLVSLGIDEELLFFGFPDNLLLDGFSWGGALPDILGKEREQSLDEFHLVIRGLPSYQRRFVDLKRDVRNNPP